MSRDSFFRNSYKKFYIFHFHKTWQKKKLMQKIVLQQSQQMQYSREKLKKNGEKTQTESGKKSYYVQICKMKIHNPSIFFTYMQHQQHDKSHKQREQQQQQHQHYHAKLFALYHHYHRHQQHNLCAVAQPFSLQRALKKWQIFGCKSKPRITGTNLK